jgi:hypothetical protein
MAEVFECEENGCDAVLVRNNTTGQICWDVKDLVCYSETNSAVEQDLFVDPMPIKFNVPSNTVLITECIPGTYDPMTGIYTVPKTAIYKVTALVTIKMTSTALTAIVTGFLIINTDAAVKLASQQSTLIVPPTDIIQFLSLTVSYIGFFTVGQSIIINIRASRTDAKYISPIIMIEQL